MILLKLYGFQLVYVNILFYYYRIFSNQKLLSMKDFINKVKAFFNIKNIIITSVGVVVIGLLLFILNLGSGSSDGLKVIPEDTSAVGVIDFYSIVQKGELDEISEKKFFDKYYKSFRREVPKKIRNIMDDFIENPSISGINFMSDIFMFYIDEGEDEKYGCMSFGISSEKKFSEFIEDILDETDIDYDIEDEDNYKYVLSTGDEFAWAWDKEKSFILVPAENLDIDRYGDSANNLEDTVEMLMELEKDERITQNKQFNKFYDNKKDMNFWMSSNMLIDYVPDMDMIEKFIPYDLQDICMSYGLDFEDEKVTFSTQVYPNQDMKELVDNTKIYDNSFNKDLFKYFPEKSYAAASLSVNPMGFYELMEDFDLDELFGGEFGDIEEQIEQELDIELEDLFKTIGGNGMFSLSGLDKVKWEYPSYDYGYKFDEKNAEEYFLGEYSISFPYLNNDDKRKLARGETIRVNYNGTYYCMNIRNVDSRNVARLIRNETEVNWYNERGWKYISEEITREKEEFLPLISIAFDIKNKKVVDKVMKKAEKELENDRSFSKEKGYYAMYDSDMPTYLGYNDEVLYITNDLKSIKAFTKGGFKSDNIGKSKISSNLKNNIMFGFLDININEYPKSLKKRLFSDFYGEREGEIMEEIFEMISPLTNSITFSSSDEYSYEVSLNTNDNDNSLETLINVIEENYKDMFKEIVKLGINF